ncbi:hypothetical protein D3C78_1271520 [compost metagenome]
MHFLRLFGRSRAARANRPDGLIGNDQFGHAMSDRMHHGRQLALDHGLRLAGFALLQRLAHADDGRDARGQRGLRLGGDHGIGFAMVLAALGMPHQGVAHAEITQHARRSFAGIGAHRMLRHVLGRERDTAARGQGLDLRQVRRGHGHGHAAADIGQTGLERSDQCFVGSQAAIHFPVSDDEFFLHDYHVKTIFPVCALESINAWA